MSTENKIKVIKQGIELEILESQFDKFSNIGYKEIKPKGAGK